MTTATITLPRQTCRGHLELGQDRTVGTLPSGETRPYATELVSHVAGHRGRFHYCADCVLTSPEIAVRVALSPSYDALVDAHLCPYCFEVIEPHYEPETGTEEFYSRHLSCVTPSSDGRFVVLSSSFHHAAPFRAHAANRYTSAIAAIEKAVDFERSNTRHNGTRFGVVDLETNAVLYETERAPLEVEVEQARRNVVHLERELRDRKQVAR